MQQNEHLRRFLGLLAVCAAAASLPAVVHAGEGGFVRLYNGKDLSGWEVQGGSLDAWKADGELLSCMGKGGGWLRAKEIYSDFVIRFDYRLPPGGNSGLGVRFPSTGNPAHDGMEIQLLDDEGHKDRNLKPEQFTGGIYYQAAAKQGAANPIGEWNQMQVTCIGPRVTVVLNGQVINDVWTDRYTVAKGKHTPLSDRPQIGHVGFQSHGTRVDFRNVELKDLTVKTPSGARYVEVTCGDGFYQLSRKSSAVLRFTERLGDGTLVSETGRPGKRMRLERMSPELVEGLSGMKVGGRRRIIVSAEGAVTGEDRREPIPQEATVVYDIEVLTVP